MGKLKVYYNYHNDTHLNSVDYNSHLPITSISSFAGACAAIYKKIITSIKFAGDCVVAGYYIIR